MPPFRVEKLSDEFGQYPLILTCSACHYERVTTPQTLGRLCGWDARLEDVAKRLRCSKCGKTEMHGAGGAGTKTATWVNNIVANARTRTSGPDHTASEAGKQSVAAIRLGPIGKNTQSIASTRRQCVHVRLHALLVFV
jgi:hypothetical protein